MALIYCLHCGKYLRLGKFYEYNPFCDEWCFEMYMHKMLILYDLKLEYWKETHPQLLNYYYDRRKVGGWYPDVGEE